MPTAKNVMFRLSTSKLPRVALLAFLLFFSLHGSAYSNDYQSIKGVIMNDGTVIRGQIIQMNTEIVQIQGPDGSVQVRKFSDVKTFIRDQNAVPESALATDAYQGPRIGIGARIGYAMFSGDDVRILGYSVDVDPEESLLFGVNVTCMFNQYFSLELSVDHINNADVDLNASGLGFDAGELSMTPIMLTARFHIPNQTPIVPYLGAGIGYYVNDFSQNRALWGSENLDIKNSFGFHLNAGAELFFTQKKDFSLNVDLKYLWSTADVDYNGPVLGTGTEDVRLDSFVASVGIKYFF